MFKIGDGHDRRHPRLKNYILRRNFQFRHGQKSERKNAIRRRIDAWNVVVQSQAPPQ